jgi:enoyl-CoA hydratase
MPTTTIHWDERVATLTLDDGKANAFRPDTLDDLESALDAAEAGDARALVIAGRAGFFSGGLDLKVLPTLAPEARTRTFARFGRAVLRIWQSPVPVVAAIDGHALGGGAILALAADVRLVSTREARIGLVEVAVGLPVPAFAVEMARMALPTPTLTPAVLHGRTWTLCDAVDAGWAEAAHDPTALATAALARARALSALAREPHATTKRHLMGPAFDRAEASFSTEVDAFIAAFQARPA